MATKKPTNGLKTRNPPETKIEYRSIVLSVFKVKKPKHKPPSSYKNLTQKSTVLVVEIFPNNHFLFLCRNPMTPPLSPSNRKELKKIEK
jgi:hypothetical protein